MSIFKNLARIVEAPIKIADKLIVEPLADAAEDVANGWAGKDDKGRKR